MRTLSAFIFVIMLLGGCKPKTKSALQTITTDSSKSNLSIPDVTELKVNSNTSTWSKEYRNEFMQKCITQAPAKISASYAFSFCNCITEKAEAKYPDEKVAEANLSKGDFENMKTDCIAANPIKDALKNTTPPVENDVTKSQAEKQSNSDNKNWSAKDQQEFNSACLSESNSSLGNKRARAYCNCLLSKAMKEYSSLDKATNISRSQEIEWENECLSLTRDN